MRCVPGAGPCADFRGALGIEAGVEPEGGRPAGTERQMADHDTTAGAPSGAPGRGALWTGRILGAIPILVMLLSASVKLRASPEMLANWARSGYPAGALLPIGIVEVACALLFAFPRTAVLGAVLVTGYLGGATATHVRAGEAAFVAPVLFGVLAWGSLWFRDPRVRALLPLRRDP